MSPGPRRTTQGPDPDYVSAADTLPSSLVRPPSQLQDVVLSHPTRITTDWPGPAGRDVEWLRGEDSAVEVFLKLKSPPPEVRTHHQVKPSPTAGMLCGDESA